MQIGRLFVLLAVFVFSLGGCAGEESADEGVGSSADDLSNTDASRVLVYSNNVENMIFDWRDLIAYMKTRNERPDIFLVQQSGDASRLAQMVNAMENTLGVGYTGRIAQANPTHTRRNNDLIPKPPSTTAIIYRTARFTFVSQETWFPYGVGEEGTATADCSRRTNDSGHESLLVRLHDKRADKALVAVSTRLWTRNPCPMANVRDTVARLGSARMQIVGGDFNENPKKPEGGLDCWYRSLADGLAACASEPRFHFTEPTLERCAGDTECLRARSGIDFVFARHGNDTPVTVSGFGTVSAAEGNAADIQRGGSDGPSNTRQRDGFSDVSDAYSTHPAHHAAFHY